MSGESTITGLSGIRKAAILIAVLGDEGATSILRSLEEDDLQLVSQEIARLGNVPKEVTLQVLEEYKNLTLAQAHIARGGQEIATKLLVKAFGEAGAREMVARLVRAQELSSSRVESLQKIDPKQLARFLEGEHPQTIALILGHLGAKHASALLMCLPAAVRGESVKRLANLRQFSPEMAEKVSTVLNRRFRSVGEQKKKTYSGFEVAADLLNNVDATTSSEILEAIEREESKLALSIRNLMFTFDDFLGVPEVQIREITGAVDKKILTLALKGASEELSNHIYKTMSSRAIEAIKEDAESLGPVRSKDVANAQLEVVALARKLESEGKITLKSEGETNMSSSGQVQHSIFSAPIMAFHYPEMSSVLLEAAASSRLDSSASEEAEESIAKITLTEEAFASRLAHARAEAISQVDARLAQEYEARTAREAEKVSLALQRFQIASDEYFSHVEAEIIKLALSIAGKILHREAQVDPMLVAALVSIALSQLKDSSVVSIRVRPEEVPRWKKHFALGPPGVQVTVVEDASLLPHDCVLETELGSANFSIDAQLKEVELGFLDVLAKRPQP